MEDDLSDLKSILDVQLKMKQISFLSELSLDISRLVNSNIETNRLTAEKVEKIKKILEEP